MIFQQENGCCNSYYDSDQERLFSEAHVVNPFRTLPETAQAAQVNSSYKSDQSFIQGYKGFLLICPTSSFLSSQVFC